ncbi:MULTISPECIES: phosphate regulon sensor histidine kinase PhoR [Dyella]|uniref:Phosphate regulon sensor protein PhoR n=2 Tax=Dyella TaxID=231454 RepID=A0A4R0YVE7_9GAMM|nr:MULTISPECIES: phosphate regulon sensor histidine kinase PhoR [Dyella]TBR38993.1 phosphate regulon sensor histidine kinase PhoR [Dyella terrae]TCI13415.1 phosphate regulon sensor histidine kinase PhoR [Dyella soli]
MPQPFDRTWKLTAAAAAGLLLGALLGWLAGDLATGLAVAGVVETVLLLSLIRHETRHMMPQTPPISPLQHDRFMTRSRRIASSLRDLRSAAGSLPDAVVLLDNEQHVRWFNHAAEDLLGLRRPQDRGAILEERLGTTELAGWLRDGAHEPLNDVVAPGHPNRHINVTLLPFGRRQRLLLARDISHLTRLEQIRRDFVANVSHELRTPLTVIHGYLELIDPEDIPELAPVIGEMRAQSKRMGQIVEDLLTLSRLETQDHVTDERVPMTPLLATIRKEAEALSQGRHHIAVESTADADLLGSPKDLHSALSNLVSNAVRYTPTGGSIVIRWRRTPEGAAYSVTDTGFGIPATHLARLTERFYRVSSSRSRDSGGTGLGLSIVKHVLNLHQARLDIQSETGKGSTFTCLFGHERLLKPGTDEV